MAHPLYNLALIAAAPMGLCALGWRLATRPEYRKALGERFGRVPTSPADAQVIWLHAVSVGEVISAVPLVTRVRETYPKAHIVVSCGTPTGRATAIERLAGVADCICYLAYDLPHLVRRAVGRIRPNLLLLVETEIWPNLLATLGERQVPVLIVNGRISRRSFPRYMMFRPLMGRALSHVGGFLMQTKRDARFIRRMGAPKAKVEVAGNIKYDQPEPDCPPATLKKYAAALGLTPGAPVLLAGSTHEGEELALARAWTELKETFPGLRLILAVRHPKRAEEVVRALGRDGIEAARKTEGVQTGARVVLLDTVGELAAHYPLATVAFVGGSLVPVGGHNPLEPAAVGVPVVYGPHVSNFDDPCTVLEQAGAAKRLAGEDDLVPEIAKLLADESLRKTMGEAGRAVFQANRGALELTMGRIRERLG